MKAPWKGPLRVMLDDTAIADEDGAVFYALDLHPDVAHALVHRANAYEGLRAALQRIADEDLDQGDTMGLGEEAMLADAVAIARRTLDSLEDSDV